MLERRPKSRIVPFGIRIYLLLARRTCHLILTFFGSLPLARAYGRHLQDLIRRYGERNQSHATFFLRNRPELELMRHLLDRQPHGAAVDLAVVACSKGAEVYSIVWKLRSARPDLRLRIRAVDISQEVVDFAAAGVYTIDSIDSRKAFHQTGDLTWKDQMVRGRLVSIFEQMTSQEMNEMFELEGDQATIKPWLKQGITWLRGDAADPEFARALGVHDVVVANRFLCHMEPAAAEACLRNIGRLVKPGGYLFVSGVDLEVRTKVARDLCWRPVMEMMREVHQGDSFLIEGWPLHYWSVEPFCDDRSDWKIRYASVFQIDELSQDTQPFPMFWQEDTGSEEPCRGAQGGKPQRHRSQVG
jgi:chemotaxis methyl-accepting protein methylase